MTIPRVWGYASWSDTHLRTGVRFGLVQTVVPGTNSGEDDYPVNETEVKDHCRIEITDDDTWITNQIKGATANVEGFLSRQLLLATYEYTLPAWPPGRILVLPRPPLSSISTVGYLASTTTDHSTYTSWASSNWYSDTASDPGRMAIIQDADIPDLATGELAPVKITFRAGYGATESTVPELFRLAIMQTIHQWYERPETMTSGLPESVKHMLWPYRSTFSDIGGWW